MVHREQLPWLRFGQRAGADDEFLHERELENGLRVLTIPRGGAPLVACRLFVAAGSRWDEGQRGRAHLSEHCLVSGARWGAESVETRLQKHGALLEAGTLRDHVHFGVTALPPQLSLAIGALGRIVRHRCDDPELLRREQEIIAHELGEHQDGIAVLWDQLYANLWQEHPFVYPAVGGEELLSLSPEDLRRHNERYVRPNRAVLAVVGKVHPEAVLEQAQRHLGAWSAARAAPEVLADRVPTPRVPPIATGSQAGLQRSYFLLGWPAPPAGSIDDAALSALARVLGEGPGGLLTRHLREQDRDVYNVQTAVQQFVDHGLFTVFGSCHPKRVEAVLARIRQLFVDVAEHPLDAGSLKQLQLGYPASLARTYETVAERAALLGRNGLYGLRRSMEDRIAMMSTLRLRDLERCRHELFASGPPAVAVLG